MADSDEPRMVTTPLEVLKLFIRGVDTADIAAHYGIREHEAYRLLRLALEARRLLNADADNTVPPVDEPTVEG